MADGFDDAVLDQVPPRILNSVITGSGLEGCLRQCAYEEFLGRHHAISIMQSQYIVSAPEVFERSSAQLRVSGRVLDVGMAQPQLQASGVVAGIGQEVPASVAQHMRVQVG